jgi:3-oxoacyl-[acyl-carrier-protein] synthase-3
MTVLAPGAGISAQHDLPLARAARIAALSAYVPERVMTNDELSRIVATDDGWIRQRTGVRTRHVAAETEYTSDVCISAVRRLVAEHGVVLDDVDYVIVCTSTADYVFPSVAALIQDAFGIPAAGAFDLSAACAGFTYGLNVANALVASGVARKVLLVGGETMTKALDYEDRTTCVLFGDGAGAAILEPADDLSGIVASVAGSDGASARHLYRTAVRPDIGGIADGSRLLRQNGSYVYKWVLEHVPGAIETLLARAGLSADAIDWFVPHSANVRIIERLCELTGIPLRKTLTSVENCGNTSAASIPIALWNAARAGRIARGDRILTIGFGGGLVYAGAVLRW